MVSPKGKRPGFSTSSRSSNRQADGGASLGVVDVCHRVDDRLANCGRGQAPSVGPAHPADGRAVQRVLLDEVDRRLDGRREGLFDPGLVEDLGAVRAGEAPGLDPGIGKSRQAIPPDRGALRPPSALSGPGNS